MESEEKTLEISRDGGGGRHTASERSLMLMMLTTMMRIMMFPFCFCCFSSSRRLPMAACSPLKDAAGRRGPSERPSGRDSGGRTDIGPPRVEGFSTDVYRSLPEKVKSAVSVARVGCRQRGGTCATIKVSSGMRLMEGAWRRPTRAPPLGIAEGGTTPDRTYSTRPHHRGHIGIIGILGHIIGI